MWYFQPVEKSAHTQYADKANQTNMTLICGFWVFFAHILCVNFSGSKFCQCYFVSFFHLCSGHPFLQTKCNTCQGVLVTPGSAHTCFTCVLPGRSVAGSSDLSPECGKARCLAWQPAQSSQWWLPASSWPSPSGIMRSFMFPLTLNLSSLSICSVFHFVHKRTI